MNTITRKVQIMIDDENVAEVYKKLYSWQDLTYKSFNFVASHFYVQEKIIEFEYFIDEFRARLIDHSKNEFGVLNTSKQSTTYRLLSKKLKGSIPTDILTNVNNICLKNFNSEKVEYFSGKRSLRTYKRNCPIPFSASSLYFEKDDSEGLSFILFKLRFKIRFGKDRSNNKIMFERMLNGEYKLCGSSIELDKNKIYLLATFQFESKKIQLDKKNIVDATLDLNIPIIASFRSNQIKIGTKEEFLHRRLQIQESRRRSQKAVKYNEGGKGRTKRMKPVSFWDGKEKEYIKNRLHKYSSELIDFCLKNSAGKLLLKASKEELESLYQAIDKINSDEELNWAEKKNRIEKCKFVLRNWSWSGLLKMIEYKAKMHNIEVVIEKN